MYLKEYLFKQVSLKEYLFSISSLASHLSEQSVFTCTSSLSSRWLRPEKGDDLIRQIIVEPGSPGWRGFHQPDREEEAYGRLTRTQLLHGNPRIGKYSTNKNDDYLAMLTILISYLVKKRHCSPFSICCLAGVVALLPENEVKFCYAPKRN